jgi:hypothetical protein
MKYKINSSWPVSGGAMMIPAGSVIDTATSPFLVGVIPPPDVTPLDQEAQNMLVQAYQLSFRI